MFLHLRSFLYEYEKRLGLLTYLLTDYLLTCLKLHCFEVYYTYTSSRMPAANAQQVVQPKFVSTRSKAYNKSETSWYVKILYSLLYDLLFSKYATNELVDYGPWHAEKNSASKETE